MWDDRSVSVYVCSEEFWSGLESILGRSVVMLAKSMQPLQVPNIKRKAR
jgi:hypothetical protein